jgi:hypothetical protein
MGGVVKLTFKPSLGFIIIVAIAIIIVVGVAAASSSPPKTTIQPTPPPQMDPAVYTVTIDRAIGINQITITNLNEGTSIKKTLIDLPYSFHVSPGDYLQFKETTAEGYVWNAWQFNDGTFDNHNPMIISISGDLVMTPKCIITTAIDTSNSTMSG